MCVCGSPGPILLMNHDRFGTSSARAALTLGVESKKKKPKPKEDSTTSYGTTFWIK